MVVKRNLSKKRYIVAGIITFIIFSFGVMLGLILDYERLDYLDARGNQQEINYRSLQLQYLYLSDIENTNESCAMLRAALTDSIEDLSYSLELFEAYEKDTTINEKQYEAVARTYLLDNIRYWIFSQRTKKVCNEDIINILYFYSKDYCNICHNQGTILTYFKAKLEDDILIFPINVDLTEKEDFIKLLRLQYNITELPTLIVNDEKYVGIVSKDELARIICENSKNKEKCLI
ncbi:hypothetical protein JXC34_07195 [Candidatus Woesearchaeota archaeon]|nr:hypothetical protein [Candidatus Woesearchaeota archaeon]